jgi:hypothetical protein
MNKPSRRAVVRTGVWAVPVVATAAAAPAFAGTGSPPPVTIDSVGSGCKLPGHSTHDGETWYGYRMVVTFENNTSSSQNVTLLDFKISGKPTDGFPVGQILALAPGDTPELFIVTSSASSQRTATITYSVSDQTYTATVTFPNFNPCKCDPKDADPADPASDCS